MREQDLQLGMEGSANLLRANKVGIDAGGSVARPESTIPLTASLFRRNLTRKIES